jgi:DNA-binding MarR family transcriptional regulator
MKIEEEIKSTIEIDINKKVMLNLNFARNTITDKFNEVLKPYGLSGEQFNVLRILRGQKNAVVNMNLIQDRMLTKNSNTTRLIDKLLNKELVTRAVCTDNRRKMNIKITQKGLDVLNELDVKVLVHENKFTDNLNFDELNQLNALLEKIRIIK